MMTMWDFTAPKQDGTWQGRKIRFELNVVHCILLLCSESHPTLLLGDSRTASKGLIPCFGAPEPQPCSFETPRSLPSCIRLRTCPSRLPFLRPDQQDLLKTLPSAPQICEYFIVANVQIPVLLTFYSNPNSSRVSFSIRLLPTSKSPISRLCLFANQQADHHSLCTSSQPSSDAGIMPRTRRKAPRTVGLAITGTLIKIPSYQRKHRYALT